ncbi:drug/metabolite transporter superfamily, partial [Macrolepiota fuliginosa MF-IS2]
FLSLMNLAAKKLNSIDLPVSVLEIIPVHMGITYICSTTYMLSTGVPDPFTGPKGVCLLLAFHGFAGFFGLFGIYFLLQFLSLSDATVLTFLAPLCTSATGALFLGEKFTWREAFAAFPSLVGVILITRPPFIFGSSNAQVPDVTCQGDNTDTPTNKVTLEERLIAVGVGLVGVLGVTGAYTSLQAIGKHAHPLHSLVLYSTQSIIVASIGMIVMKMPFIMPTRLSWFTMLIMIGIFGFIAQVLLTMGFAHKTTGQCLMGMYMQIIFATILKQIFYHMIPAILSIIGMLIIISCALYVAVCVKLTVIYVYY